MCLNSWETVLTIPANPEKQNRINVLEQIRRALFNQLSRLILVQKTMKKKILINKRSKINVNSEKENFNKVLE